MPDFSCQRCGECCRLQGWVLFSDSDVHAISEYLSLSQAKVRDILSELDSKRFFSHGAWSIVGYWMSDGCVFLGERGCTIYPVRPEQCRRWPLEAPRIRDTSVCPAMTENGGDHVDKKAEM